MPRRRRPTNDNLQDISNDGDGPPPSRKARTVRGKRGGLENLPQMPLDVIIEILKYLKPHDLLRLARTSRDFRKYLMARSAASLWKAARENVEGLPECPPHLSEPAYANLAFDSHCHSCLRPKTKHVMWQFGARYCDKCKKSQLRQCDRFPCLSGANSCREVRVCYFIQKCGAGILWHHRRDLEDLQKKLPSMNEGEMNALIQKNKDIMVHAQLCEVWQRSVILDRQDELDLLRQRRYLAVSQKLKESGYDDELNLMQKDGRIDELLQHPFVKQAKELTGRMWSNAKDGILQFMENLKQRRLYDEMDEALWCGVKHVHRVHARWRTSQPTDHLLPRGVDIICLPDFITELGQPPDVPFGSCLSNLDAIIDDYVVEWHQTSGDILRTKLKENTFFREDIDPLALAATVFSCTKCTPQESGPFFYPAISHDCCYELARDHSEFGKVLDIDPHLASVVSSATHKRLPWSPRPLELGLWHQRAITIIEACGQDPTTATCEEMDALPIRLWCIDCSELYSAGDIRQVMTWRDAFDHYTFHDKHAGATGLDSSTSPLNWACVSGDELEPIIEMEDQLSHHYLDLESSRQRSAQPRVACVYCYAQFTEYRDGYLHLASHSIPHFSADDLYQHTEYPPRPPRATTLVRRVPKHLKPADLEKQVEIFQKSTGCEAPPFLHDF